MKSISKIKVKGGYYTDEIEIDLSKTNDTRLSVIYGVNGSGKSCISSAICEYKDSLTIEQEKKVYEHVSFLNDDCNEISHSQEYKEKIWVYNEKYLDDNIRWNEDYLGSIVMFGEQTQIDEELKEVILKIEDLENKKNQINIEKYEDSKGTHSLKRAKDSVVELLRSNWANRDKNIRGMTRNTSVNDQIINDIVSIKKPTQSLAQLRSEYDMRYAELKSVNSDTVKYLNILMPDIQIEKEKELINLLAIKIDKPEGNELEDKLYSLIESGVNNYINSSFVHFSEHDESECPFCLQNLDSVYKEKLINSIKNVLNPKVKNHISELEISKIVSISLDLEHLRSFDNERVNEIYQL